MRIDGQRRTDTGRRRLHGVLTLGLAVALVALATGAAQASFAQWREGLWRDARIAGVSRAVFDAAMAGVDAPDPEVIEQLGKQAEFVKPIWEYLARAVSDARVEKGRAMLEAYAVQLDAIERFYGVDRHVVLAIWGMETNYGGYLGSHYVIRALATLAYQGRRRDYFRRELVNALVILEQGHTTPHAMEGSWAGAMGHTQFMPSSFRAYAADYDGDRRRDIWTNVPDALASTANYLREHGWRGGETWGYEVALPRGFNYAYADDTRTIAEWSRLGVSRTHGRAFPRPNDQAKLILPAGARGPAFLMLPTYRVILRYNNAMAYAIGVGHLSDRIRGGEPFSKPWPVDDPPLQRGDTKALQTLLTRRGFDTGGIDGKVGPMTRRAIRGYQAAIGVVPDGYPSYSLLERLRRGS